MMNNNNLQKQLAKLRRNKKLLWLGILFLVLIILWILMSIFATTKTSVISPEQRELAKSFVPRLESKVFEEIALKRAFSEEELANFSIFVIGKDQLHGENAVIDIMSLPETTMETELTDFAETTPTSTEADTLSTDSAVAPDLVITPDATSSTSE